MKLWPRSPRECDCGDLPAAVIAKAKLHLLDLVGVALAASTLEFGGAALAPRSASAAPATAR